VGDDTDLPIDRIMGWLKLGALDRVLASEHIWRCVGCHACSARCPNEVDPGMLLDYLRVLALARKIDPPARVKTFHAAFIDQVKKRGRSGEIALMSKFYRKHGIRYADIIKGYHLFRRRRLLLFGGGSGGKDTVRKIFESGTEDPGE